MNRMPPMSSDAHGIEFEELAAGFAFAALTVADVERFRTHLADCRRCQQLVAEYRAVVAILPDELEEIDASPGLKGRIVEAARVDSTGRPPEREHRAIIGQDQPTPFRQTRRRENRFWALGLAALLALTIGLGYWNYQLQAHIAQQTAALQAHQQALTAIAAGGRQWVLTGTDQVPGARGILVQDPRDQQPILVVYGLPELPPRQSYQAWVIVGGTPTGAGLLEPGPEGQYLTRLQQPLVNVDTVALTIEPAGGSPAPTGPIVVAGNL